MKTTFSSCLQHFPCEPARVWGSAIKTPALKASNLTYRWNLQGKGVFFIPVNWIRLKGAGKFSSTPKPRAGNSLPASPRPALPTLFSSIPCIYCDFFWYLERMREFLKSYLRAARLDFAIKVSWDSSNFLRKKFQNMRSKPEVSWF